MKEHAEHVTSQLSKMKSDFLRHKSRLASVRAEISAKQTRPYGELICNDGPVSSKEITDFLSDTSSVADSISSRRSQTSTASGYIISLLRFSQLDKAGYINASFLGEATDQVRTAESKRGNF